MGKFLAAVIAGILGTVIGGLILNQLQGKARRRGDAPEISRPVASLPLEHAAPFFVTALDDARPAHRRRRSKSHRYPLLMLSHHGHTPGVSS
jgi:hypothetical protein